MGRGEKGAREIAYEVLTTVEEREAFAERALDKALEHSILTDDRDRALATEIIYGVIRQRGLLDRIIRDHSRLPLERIDREVLRVLRLGAYQILLLDRVPDHAAVSQSVELSKRYCPQKSAQFLNAVLRSICREKESARTKSILNTPEEGQPLWLAKLWNNELGHEQAQALFRNIQHPPETILRVNLLKTTQRELLEEMKAEGYGVEPVYELPGTLRVIQGRDLRKSEAYRTGKFVQQDAASQSVTWILDPSPGQRVLDCCAAPGIKTTHISEKMEGRGLIVALDRHSGKLRKLAYLCEQMGMTIVHPMCADAAGEGGIPIKGVTFDRILVDVPCSGLGTLRRTPERKWRKAPDFSDLCSLQYRILEAASRLLSPGGILVYSTCTVVRQENDGVLERFLSERKDFIVEDASQYLPEALRDLVCNKGIFRSWLRPSTLDFFFAARLRRR